MKSKPTKKRIANAPTTARINGDTRPDSSAPAAPHNNPALFPIGLPKSKPVLAVCKRPPGPLRVGGRVQRRECNNCGLFPASKVGELFSVQVFDADISDDDPVGSYDFAKLPARALRTKIWNLRHSKSKQILQLVLTLRNVRGGRTESTR